MKIGFDVDGVLTHLDDYQLKYGKKYFKNKSSDEINETEYNIKDIFNCSNAEREKFWAIYIWKYCLTEPIREDAKIVINKLKEDGNEIHLITGRAHTTEDGQIGKLFRNMLEYYLKKNGIKYDSINYCSEDQSADAKYDICKQLGIEVMVEDKKENIEKLSTIDSMHTIVCIDAKYNQEVEETEKIHRTSNLWDAYKIISSSYNSFSPKKHDEVEKMTSYEKKVYFNTLSDYYQNLPYDKSDNDILEKNYVKSLTVGLPMFKLMYKPIIINKDKIPEGNGHIFVSNHLGYLDQFPIMCAIGNRPIHFLAASTLLPMKRGVLYKNTGCIFVDRQDKKSRERSKDKLAQYILNGSNVFLFPEGTRNRTSDFLLDFKLGAVSLARETGAKIVPFAVNNNYKINGDSLIVRAGDFLEVKYDDDLIEKNDELRDRIATLIWENMDLEKEIDLKKIKTKKSKI